ncbi:MAG: DUF4290 domain-containing protein [Rikenellaceae bacterium]
MIPKDYNSERDKLIFPEYGRHIQEMVKQLLTIEDSEERTRQAYIVVDVMGNLNNTLRDTNDFKHKLWDHLFILSDFQLNVNFPYEIPSSEQLTLNPEKIEYPKLHIGYKQYGKNIRTVISKIREKENCAEKEIIASDIVKFMKFKSYEYNQEYPSNEVVINDFRKFSMGEIEINEDALSATKINIKKPKLQSSGAPKKDQALKPHRNLGGTTSNNSQNNNRKPKPMNNSGQPKRYFRHKEEVK